MIKGDLIMAMDFSKRKGVQHTVISHQQDGTWYVIKEGPRYRNVYKVTEYDEVGLKLLQSLERK